MQHSARGEWGRALTRNLTPNLHEPSRYQDNGVSAMLVLPPHVPHFFAHLPTLQRPNQTPEMRTRGMNHGWGGGVGGGSDEGGGKEKLAASLFIVSDSYIYILL